MRPLLQAFASGLFIAVLIMAVVYNMNDTSSKAGDDNTELTTDEMINELKNSDYVIHTEEEWNQAQKQEVEEETNSEPPHPIHTFEVTVSQGMSSKDISKKLQNASIIQDAAAFNDYLIDNGFSKKIQTGTFLVDDQMTQPELAETLTSE